VLVVLSSLVRQVDTARRCRDYASGMASNQALSRSDSNGARSDATSARTGVIALVPHDFNAGVWSSRHHVLTRLAHHYPVVWVEPARDWRELWRPARSSAPPAATAVAGLQVLAPRRFQPNLYRPRWLRRAVRRARLNLARDALLEQGVQRVVLYIWRPEFADALDLVQHDFSCYHIDDDYSFAKVDQGNSPEEVALIGRVDQVIVHSRQLIARKGGINPRTVMIPNGVDFDAYVAPHREPADIARIARPRIGYVGVIKSQLDIELMLTLARRLPQASFVFVGPTGVLGEKQGAWDQLAMLPNVHVLGGRDVTELPAYTQQLDVCLMCYEVNAYTHAIYPLKLHEYLAAGRLVIASRINSVLPFESVVRVADTVEDWVSAILAGLAEPLDDAALIESRRAIARAHDWNRLVRTIAGLFDPAAPGVGAAR
jgi:glycosyltransferase involved in cell wall biosynthesis